MSTDQLSAKNNVKLFSNRFPQNKFNKSESDNTEKKRIVCEDVEYSSEDTSSSDEEIFLDNYSTKKIHTNFSNYSSQSSNVNYNSKQYTIFNNLGIIFERSDESSVSSQTTLTHDESISPSIFSTNQFSDNDDDITTPCDEITPIIDKTCNLTFTENQPMNDEIYKEIGFVEIQPINNEIQTHNHFNQNSSLFLNSDESLRSNQINMRNDMATSTLAMDLLSEVRDAHVLQTDVYHCGANNTNKPSTLLSQTELIFNKRTPRFHIKNNSNSTIDCEGISLINNSVNNYIESKIIDKNMERKYPMKKPDIPKKPSKEQLKKKAEQDLITDLDDLEQNDKSDQNNNGNKMPQKLFENDNKSGSIFKLQMFKNYSQSDLRVSHRYEKKNEIIRNEREIESLTLHDRNSPSRRSQEITGSIMKMDKTINKVNDNIVKIDNVIDKMAGFNKNFMSNLEMMSDAELSSDFETQSIGAQTDAPVNAIFNNKKNVIPFRKIESSSSDESSTEKESDTDEGEGDVDDSSVSLKPSPVHLVVNNQTPLNKTIPNNQPKLPTRTVNNLKSQFEQRHDSDLSSLPESLVCDEPEKRDLPNQVKYFQRQIIKSAGLHKKPGKIESPKRLVVSEDIKIKVKPVNIPIPKPRYSIDGSVQGTLNNRLSNSSSGSSSYNEHQRTLSNSNDRNHSANSPVNSESGSFVSLNSNNHFERRFPNGSTGRRYIPKSKVGDKYGTATKIKTQIDDEAASFTGKNDPNSNPMKRFMTQSRSYNSLNALNSQFENERLRSGSLAALNNNGSPFNIEDLCNLIQQHLSLKNFDRIQSIFAALLHDNNQDGIEDIIDHFGGKDRSILLEIASKVGYGLKEADSIFDMTMSRSDLHNNLRPGLSISTLSDMNYQHTIGSDQMIFWRPDIEEHLPPPMKPLPKVMATNLLKSAIITPESLQNVDEKVVEVLQFEPTTFTELVEFLTRDYSKDIEKVRALFRWITMYDMKHLNFDPAAPNETLIGVLRSVKCGQMSYNELFFRMCRFAGIHCQFICGYSKGAGYKPGMTIKDNRMFRNVWTSVYVAGAWRFVNCNWGARYLSGGHHEPILYGTLTSNANNIENIETKYRCDEFYFLTDPKQHIFEHFPDKKKWQLLTRSITLDQFMALPILKSPFFNANLSFKRNYPETLQTKNGKVTVKINMPKAIGISCRLENRSDNSILRGLTLVRVLDNQMIMVTAAPSQPGKFYFSIYVSDDWKSEEGREMACSFQIHCSEHNYDRLVTGRFPEVGVLGTTPAAQNLGIVVNIALDPFVIWEERSTMKLNLVLSPGLRISHKMMSYDRSGQNSSPCDSYALFQYHSQGRHQYHLRFPIDAFYCLTIFGGVNDPHMPETEPMECIYRLLVDCRHAQDRIPPFPRQTSRWVGFELIEPLCQHLDLNKVYRFRIMSSECSSLAVVINENNWYDLSVSGKGLWKSKINTGQELGNLSVYGKFGNDSNDEEFIKLLDYVLVQSVNK